MPRHAKPLVAKQVETVKYEGKPRKLFDGGGLFLLVLEERKSWRLKYRYGGMERLMVLGTFPEMSLKAAREARAEKRKLLADGREPAREKRAENADKAASTAYTFEAVAREWCDQVHRHQVVEAHAKRNLRRLELHAFPAMGREPIAEITSGFLLDVLQRLQRKGRVETAHRVRTLCGQVFRYAIVQGRAERDVAADLKGALRTAEVQHHAALTDPAQFARLLRAIDSYSGQPSTTAALRLAPFVFVRPGELRSAKWESFDLASGEWDFQPSKGGIAMVTPLPRQAREILEEQYRISGDGDYAFPSSRGRGRPLSENTLNAALSSMGFKGMMTAHGFRAVARTILVEHLNQPVEWVEMQLGHAVRDALGRAYNRTTYLEQRRNMLQRWADYLDHLRESVVALRRDSGDAVSVEPMSTARIGRTKHDL
ncbi:MAG: integrase arm-type DNA-binding domain-containing protein [Chloroflexi bacterium]|nr:integrase arm-type DNA-binding domain-containing protein [Chloroflexota bacterium]